MILTKINHLFPNHSLYPSTSTDLDLGQINLIVGKNGVGKSRALRLIYNLARIINGQKKGIPIGKYQLIFQDKNKDNIEYFIHNENGVLKKEKLSLNSKTIIQRTALKTEIFSHLKENIEVINPPRNKLVIQVRRDKLEYPIVEKLANWAENVHFFGFGGILPYQKNEQYGLYTSSSNIIEIIEHLKKDEKDHIIEEFNRLSYYLTDIKIDNLFFEKKTLQITEKGIALPIPQGEISQGMFRSLLLLIFINYLIEQKKVSTLLIDDLCEGLDYERATKLGKLLLEKVSNSNIQLVASSNDSFLMDVFPIKYWNVLLKHKTGNQSFNYQNSKPLFDEFKFMGLSNFDLFSSDYLLSKI